MRFFTKKIIGIDFHDYSAQIAALSLKSDLISLEAFNRVIIPPNILRNGEILNEPELVNLLKTFLDSANPHPIHAKCVALVLPADKIFTHIFAFPANLNEDDIKKALPYQAETVIPFSIQDVYFDFEILERESQEKHATQYVLFAAVSKEIADKYAHLMESVGLNPFLFGIHADCLRFALHKQIETIKTSLIIEIGCLSTNYVILKNNAIQYFLSSNSSGLELVEQLKKNFQVPESVILEQREKNTLEKTFLPEIKNFIAGIYKRAQEIVKESEKNIRIGTIDAILLTGEFLNFPQFFELAKKAFPKKTLLIGDPKIGIEVDVTKFLPLAKIGGSYIPYSIYFTNSVGIAVQSVLKKDNEGINLLPDRLRETFSLKRHSLIVALTSITLCFISLFLAAFFFFQHQSLEYERLALETKKKAVERLIYGTRYQEIRDSIISFNNEVGGLTKIDSGLFSLPEVLQTVIDLVPNEVSITGFTFKDDGLSIELNGIAANRDVLLETKQNFEEADFIKEVIAPLSNYDAKNEISFIIKLKLDIEKLPSYGSNTFK